MTKVLVITATVGRADLRRCAESVQRQTHSNVRHLVVVDGPLGASAASDVLEGLGGHKPLDLLILPRRTGHSGHFGYRIYGAQPLLADEDLVLFLDEDNWFDADHIASCIDTFKETGAAWVYALRRICSDFGDPLCDDDCDSLGYWPKLASLTTDHFGPDEAERHRLHPSLVDSSCYALPRQLACTVAPLWQNCHADSVVASHLVRGYAGACTAKTTVNYALGGGSGTAINWFTEGNSKARNRYGANSFPWRQGPRLLGPGSLTHPQFL